MVSAMAPPRKPGPIRSIQILLDEEEGRVAEALYERVRAIHDRKASIAKVFGAAMWLGMPEVWAHPAKINTKPPHFCADRKGKPLRATKDTCRHDKPKKA